MSDLNKEVFELIKSEVPIVFNQMHARMSYKNTILNIIIVFISGVITATNISSNSDFKFWLLLLSPFFIFVFGFISIREDILLRSHDDYINNLRELIINDYLRNKYENYEYDHNSFVLGFLDSMKGTKQNFLNIYTSLLPHLIVALYSIVSLLGLIFIVEPSYPTWVKTTLIFILSGFHIILSCIYINQLRKISPN